MKYQYAISAGPGTLIAYGVCDGTEVSLDGLAVLNVEPFVRIEPYDGLPVPHIMLEDGDTLIIAPCSDDCTTGA